MGIMTEVQKELDRWHNFSDGAIGNRQALMTLFIATVEPSLKGELQSLIRQEIGISHV
jgi:hypothetical protein